MPTSARWEVTTSPEIPVKSVHSAGPMWASAPTVKWAGAYGFALGFRFSLLPAATSQALRASSPERGASGCRLLLERDAPVWEGEDVLEGLVSCGEDFESGLERVVDRLAAGFKDTLGQ